MALDESNLKILKSEDLSDFPDGGGRITNKEVIDGKSNDLFLDIPDTSRAYGDLDLVKVFPAVVAQTNEPLLGGVFSLGDLPEDPTVAITMFTTKDWFDRRKDAIKYVENYLSPADKLSGALYDRQLKTQRVVQLIAEVDAPLPSIGRSYYLVQNEGQANEFNQYILVSAITYEDRTFTISGKKEKFRIITLDITTQLEYTFNGVSATDFFSGRDPVANIRNTRVTDSARFYTSKRLEKAVKTSENKVYVDGVFTQLVPSSKTETPLSALSPNGRTTSLVPSGNLVSFALSNYAPSTTNNLYVGMAIYPTSLTLSVSGGVIKDEGGLLKLNDVTIGNVNYTQGLITWLSNYTTRSDMTITFKPASAPKVTPQSTVIKIDEASRSFTYTLTLLPAPTPTSLTVSYVVLGNVYTLEDKGDGVLVGFDSSFGTGNINYETGDLILSLGAEPDVGSYILLNWGASRDVVKTPSRGSTKIGFDIQLEKSNDLSLLINPTTIKITWNNGVDKTAVVGLDNKITGDATGFFYQNEARLYVEPKNLPAKGVDFKVDYKYNRRLTESKVATITQLNVSSPLRYDDYYLSTNPSNFDLKNTQRVSIGLQLQRNVTKGSVSFQVPVYANVSNFEYEKVNKGKKLLNVFDVPLGDETGVFRCSEYPDIDIGTINYQTGDCSVWVSSITEQNLIRNYNYRIDMVGLSVFGVAK